VDVKVNGCCAAHIHRQLCRALEGSACMVLGLNQDKKTVAAFRNEGRKKEEKKRKEKKRGR